MFTKKSKFWKHDVIFSIDRIKQKMFEWGTYTYFPSLYTV